MPTFNKYFEEFIAERIVNALADSVVQNKLSKERSDALSELINKIPSDLKPLVYKFEEAAAREQASAELIAYRQGIIDHSRMVQNNMCLTKCLTDS